MHIMNRMKRPGKHRNNSTKSNRTERECIERESIVNEKALINKAKKYLIHRLRNRYYSSRYVGYDNLQEEFNISECEARKLLNRLEKMGFIKLAAWCSKKKKNIVPRYEILYDEDKNMPDNIISEKFGQQYIKLPGCPTQWRYREKGEYIHNNILINLFNKEKDIIEKYKDWAEFWKTIPAVKKPIIFKNFIMNSVIISCHFLHACKSLDIKERQKIITKIKSNSSASLWAYTNCELQNKEKPDVLNSILKSSSYHGLLLEILKSKSDREKALNVILDEYNLCDQLTKYGDKIIDTDLILIAKLLQKINNQEIAFKVNNMFTFNDEEKDYFAHLVIAYNMTNMNTMI